MAHAVDRLAGLVLMSGGVFIFLYYTLWVIILPFVPPENIIHAYFPPRIVAVLLPVIAGVIGLITVAIMHRGLRWHMALSSTERFVFHGLFVVYVILSDKKKKKSS